VFVSIVATLSAAGTVHAGGFEIPGFGARATARGGAFSVLANDLTAFVHNPGGLSRLTGTHMMYNHMVVYNPVTFTRAETGIPNTGYSLSDPPGDPLAPSENKTPIFGLGASIGIASDFGLDDWTFAFLIHGPNSVGQREFDVNGGQRYVMTKFDTILIEYSLGVAYGKKDVFGVGAALHLGHSPKTNFDLVTDGGTSEDELHPYYNTSGDVLAKLSLSDPFCWGLTLGAWWRPVPSFEFGASGRVVPITMNLAGDLTLENTPQSNFSEAQLAVTDSEAQLVLEIPMSARVGVRYRGLEGDRELFDIELNFVWENYSSLEAYETQLGGMLNLYTAVEAPDLHIEKQWKDTLSLRLGGSYNLVEDALWLSGGAFWERGAAPAPYATLDFMSFDRYGAAGGIRWSGYGIDITLAYMWIAQADVENTEAEAKYFQQRPIVPCPEKCDGYAGVPANAGKIESAYHQVNIGMMLHFDDWF